MELEIDANECVDYGGLLAFMCILHKVPPFPQNFDILELSAWIQIHEVILAAMEDYPITPLNQTILAEFIGYTDHMRSFAISILGGHRGDRTALLTEARAHFDEFPRRLGQLALRLGRSASDAA